MFYEELRRNFFLSLPLSVFMHICICECLYIGVCPCVQVYLRHIPHRTFFNDWLTSKNFNDCEGIGMAQVESLITSDPRLPRVPLIATDFSPVCLT